MDHQYFSRLLPQLADRSQSAVLSRLGFAHVPLYRYLAEMFSRPFGEPGSFLADPTFEAVFGWTEGYSIMTELAGQLLTEELIQAMDQPPKELVKEYRFGKDRHPYKHQLEAWKILAKEIPQSLVVASGTGSGKTECFMVPILDRLARLQAEKNGRLTGVRALFLYPLNALINSQRERLRAWTYNFDDNIRFCLFNGNTPEKLPAHQKRDYPNEVMDRETLRASPPPILVTNATMLEYMLVRTVDAPILEQSQGKLEWVVLDEAHTYVGSQAAEIALLIRRVLHAFGVRSDQVRFVATSATIGDPNGAAGEMLKRFLADVAGVGLDRVHLVAGHRHIPELPEGRADLQTSFDELSSLDAEKKSDEDTPNRYASLSVHSTARAIRRLFIENEKKNREKGGNGMVARLSEVCQTLFPSSNTFTRTQQQEALRWLDLLSATRSADNGSFLPLRAHLFHQTLSGIWACADPKCPEKADTALQDVQWPFGQIYLEPRQHCQCGSPAYELVACDDCGAPHLLAADRDGKLLQPRGYNAIDEFELEAEPSEEANDEEEQVVDEEASQHPESKILIVNRHLENTGEEIVHRQSRRRYAEAVDGTETLRLIIQDDGGDGLVCPCCGGGSSGARRRKLFQEARIGAPFSLGVILPTLLEFAPDGDKPADHPYRGRRLLTFNDSRQGTARIAAKLQQESERNRVRGLVYHLALRDGMKRSEVEATKLENEIAEDDALLRHIPTKEGKSIIEGRLTEKRKKLDSLSKPTPIPFDDMARELASQGQDFKCMLDHYRDDVSHETYGGPEGSLDLARMFLVREFGRRPKRLNNLESMGMVAVHYPALNKITVPHQGFTLDEWRSFLKVALDFFVRAGGSLGVSKSCRHWLGIPFPQTWLIERDRKEKATEERRWPRAQYTLKKGKRQPNIRSTLVRLLAYVLNADIETAYGEGVVDAALGSAWKALTDESGILQATAGGRRILPLNQLAFAPVTTAWVCPVTRRFLDTTLRGITPYIPLQQTDATAKCRQVKLPLYDKPFGGDDTALTHMARSREWLARQEEISLLREEGLWPVVNDLTLELSPYFVTAEHSAQQPADRLKQYEAAFKTGDLNLLSCSTTMEMGIDIGGIAMVAMNNVPPHPANYLQRAGRAGRRKEPRSVSLTLCKSNPHDQIVFSKTDWPFVTSLPAPMVSLNSAVIVQRHINSLVLTHFLATQIATDGQDALKLTCGWFFTGIDGRVPVERFIAWCQAFDGLDELLVNGLRQLVRNSLFEGLDSIRLVRKAGESVEAVVEVWNPEWEALNRQEEGVKGAGESNPAYKAAQYQKERMAGEYLLRELATQGFLPAYGFPTHIAAFDNLTASQFKRTKREREEKKGEDNRYRRRELASRDSVMALREYAPGAEVVMDGLVYRSAGITLNWKAPASEQEARETQAIKYAWRCDRCNHSGSSRLFDETSHCSECNAEIKQENRRTFLEPAGFSVDFYDEPDNDVTTQDFIPVEAPWVSANGDWSLLPNPDFGRFRVTTRGHLFHQSNGLHGEGYAICLACGRAEPMNGESVPKKLLQHKKLRGGKNTKGSEGREECPGSHESWAIKPGVTLGHEGYTDALEIQLKSESGIWLNDKVTALTLSVALRDALAELLGVQANELGCDEKEARPESGSRCRSILIYDRFAAGYASNAGQFMDQIFRVARDRLNCPANCDSACPHCVLDFDQRFAAESLDRRVAIKLLTDGWLQSLRLPDELAYFGPSSRVEHGNILEAVLRASRKLGAGEVCLFAGGSPDEWDIGPSPLRALAYQLAAAQRKVEIVIEKHCFDVLDDVNRQLLASLVDYPGSLISVRKVANLAKAGGAPILAELRDGEKTYQWAIANVSATIFGMAWGKSTAPLIVGNNLEPLPLNGESVTSKQLRRDSVVIGDKEIEVFHELDGPLQGFGKRFWKHIGRSHSKAASLLSESGNDVVRISYHDRYLFSPLAAALLVDLITGLRDTVGQDRCGNAAIEITTTNEPSLGKNRNGYLWDNWADMVLRNGAIIHALEYHGVNAVIHAVDKYKSLHGRVFEVEFSPKSILTVRLDQGVSYWRARSSNHGKFFNFDEPDLIVQGMKIAEMSIDVESSSFPTHLFTKIRGGRSE